MLYIACGVSRQIEVMDTSSQTVSLSFSVPAEPTGLAVSADGKRLYVTCAAAASLVYMVSLETGEVGTVARTGHTSMAPTLSPDCQTLYVCNRFDNDISIIPLQRPEQAQRLHVGREPIAAALSPDGRWLVVALHLHEGRADVDWVAAEVVVVDTSSRSVAKRIQLPNGSGLLRGVAISPDGKYAAITHVLSRFYLPTTQVDRGWMNSNALTLLDLEKMEWLTTVLLDEIDRGAANPWGVAWAEAGPTLVVTHAGTHEVSLIDASGLLAKIAARPRTPPAKTSDFSASQTQPVSDVPNDLAFLVGLRRRVALSGHGPRAIAVAGPHLYVANYFSDRICVLDLRAPTLMVFLPLAGLDPALSLARRGEALFNDGTLCFQGWQSCASCHSSDARVDGLNWDLLNDGVGNPKNTHSLLLSHQTPPAMSQGVRETAAAAVRAGLHHILFNPAAEEAASALDEYLQSLQPLPSPSLQDGNLSPAARRGRRLFLSAKLGCANCHPEGLFTSLQSYDVGTRANFDTTAVFDTPSLVELWRTAPYLHDGSAETIRDVLTTHNPGNRHGHTSHLKTSQLDDLEAYLLSL